MKIPVYMSATAFVELLAARTGLPVKDVSEVLRVLADELGTLRERGLQVFLHKIGTFKGVKQKQRVAVAPTGHRAVVPERMALKFRGTAHLRGLQE